MKTQENLKNKKRQKLKEKGRKNLKEKSKKKGEEKREKKNSKEIKNKSIHDSIFRKTYQNKSNALDLFQIILTKKEYHLFKWSTLQTELTTHFNKDWEETIADLIFSVELKEQDLSQESQRNQIENSKNHKDKAHDVSRIRFIFLFEHKSYRDPNIAFQLLKYQFYIYEKREKIPIIPIVFYHGEKEWNIPCEFKESLLFDLNRSYRNQCDSLLEGMLNFKYM